MLRVVFLIALALICATGLAQAEPVEDFTLPSISGADVSLSQMLEGEKLLVLGFWCGGCDECKQLVPFLSVLHETYTSTAVAIAAIAADTYFSETETADIFNQAGSEYSVLLDDGGRIGKQLKVNRYPTVLILGSDRNVLWANLGFSPGTADAISAAVTDLLNGYKPSDSDSLDKRDKEQEKYERDALMIWRRFIGKCRNRYIWEIDDDMARMGFAIIDEGIEETQHGRQPYHEWEGVYEYHDTVFTVKVHLTYGRANWYFYNVFVDGRVWGG